MNFESSGLTWKHNYLLGNMIANCANDIIVPE